MEEGGEETVREEEDEEEEEVGLVALVDLGGLEDLVFLPMVITCARDLRQFKQLENDETMREVDERRRKGATMEYVRRWL